jgi:OmpA-OmpF porin, OOP family
VRRILTGLCLLIAAAPAMAQPRSCPLNDPPPPPPAQQIIIDPFFIVFFALDSAAIEPEAVAMLDRALTIFSSLPGCPAVLSAHSDRSGPDGYNLALSRRRAASVATYLRRRGVTVEIRIEAFGEGRPLVETADGVREPQNRRVELLLVRTGPR